MADWTAAQFADAFEGLLPALERNLKSAALMAGHEAVGFARMSTAFKDHSAVLRNSIDVDGPDGSFAGGDLSMTLAAGAPYASFVEDGTRAHEIRPKFRKALRWPGEGGFMFAKVVKHPGTKPSRFLATALEKMSVRLEASIIPDAIELSFVQVGFSPG